MSWAVSHLWATRGDGNQSGGNVGLSDDGGDSSSSEKGDGGELHSERRVVGLDLR